MNAAKLHCMLHVGLAIMACLSQPVLAQSTPKIDCDKAVTTPELNWCSGQELDRADKKLNAAYQKALAQIAQSDGMTKKQREQWAASLREAQRHWIAFRDKDCGEVIGYEWFGGTGMTSASLGCMITKTDTRTQELEARYGER